LTERVIDLEIDWDQKGRLFSYIVESEENKKWAALSYNPEKEYYWFVDRVRNNFEKFKIEAAVVLAIEYMPEYYVIKPFLKEHRTEIVGIIASEYTETIYNIRYKKIPLGLAKSI